MRVDAFDLKTIRQGTDAIKLKIKELNQKKRQGGRYNSQNLTAKEQELMIVYEIALEMIARQITLGNINLNESAADTFKINKNNKGATILVPPFIIIDGLGPTVAESIVRARRNGPIRTLSDLKTKTQLNKTLISRFQKLNIIDDLVQPQFSLDL